MYDKYQTFMFPHYGGEMSNANILDMASDPPPCPCHKKIKAYHFQGNFDKRMTVAQHKKMVEKFGNIVSVEVEDIESFIEILEH